MNLKPILLVSALAGAAASQAATLAAWTFESLPTTVTAGPFSPETGAGSAKGSHAATSTYSSPAGNGSTKSFSSTAWAVGDYYQFQVSTTGSSDVSISFDQTSSNTGPGQFKLAYSTDGTTFTDFANYTVLANGATPNVSWSPTVARQSGYTNTFNLSTVTALNGKANVYLRLVDRSTVSANGGTVAATGTDRVDNVTISASPVPEPASMVALGLGAVAMVRRRRASK